MSMDTVFWIASCTKLLAAMACMQAVEQGKLKLNDAKQIYQLCPELEKVKVLQDDGTLVDKKNDITLEMLLNHTAGFGYEFFNPKLRDYGRPIGFDVFHAGTSSILETYCRAFDSLQCRDLTIRTKIRREGHPGHAACQSAR